MVFSRSSSGHAARRRLVAAAGWLLVLTFVFVPTIARGHDRLSASDSASAFKFSKNIERPHEKPAPVSLGAAAAAPLVDALVPGDGVSFSEAPVARYRLAFGPIPLRAPPAR